MTETPYALAHHYALMVPAPDGVDAAIADVMARHEEELNAALAPLGVALADLLQPTWMRAVRVADVEALRSPYSPTDAVVNLDDLIDTTAGDDDAERARLVAMSLVDSEPGGCCGSGDACSDCAAAPAVDGVYVTDQLRDAEGFGERIAPEPRNDAAVFGAPKMGTADRGQWGDH